MNYKKQKAAAAILFSVMLVSLFCSCSLGEGKEPKTSVQTTSNVVTVTFPEGSTVSQIAQKLEENGVCGAQDFMVAANDPLSLEGFSFEIPNPEERAFLLEGYIFPDTYEFYKSEGAASAIKRFLKNTQSKLDDDVRARCDELGYTVDEILTIASVTQEEAGYPNEMYKVSSVIHNRLNSSAFPKLQCDAATFYLRDYVKPYVDEQRYDELTELYNTYKCRGLPAGPITNSGMEAITAALYPAQTEYYFFISDNDGVYHYAETWEEHLENCDKAGL